MVHTHRSDDTNHHRPELVTVIAHMRAKLPFALRLDAGSPDHNLAVAGPRDPAMVRTG